MKSYFEANPKRVVEYKESLNRIIRRAQQEKMYTIECNARYMRDSLDTAPHSREADWNELGMEIQALCDPYNQPEEKRLITDTLVFIAMANSQRDVWEMRK